MEQRSPQQAGAGASWCWNRQARLLLALLLACVPAIGCVNLRLLLAKQQLQEPARYFKINDQGELSIEFFEPVLLERDLTRVLGNRPLHQSFDGERIVWWYELQKLHTDDSAETSLTLRVSFVDGKLKKLALPARLAPLFRKERLLQLLPSLRDGTVKKDAEGLSYRWSNNGIIENEPGFRDRVEQVLGTPFMATSSSTGITLVYSYGLVPAGEEGGQKRPRIVLLWMTFADNGSLQHCRIAYHGFVASFIFAPGAR